MHSLSLKTSVCSILIRLYSEFEADQGLSSHVYYGTWRSDIVTTYMRTLESDESVVRVSMEQSSGLLGRVVMCGCHDGKAVCMRESL